MAVQQLMFCNIWFNSRIGHQLYLSSQRLFISHTVPQAVYLGPRRSSAFWSLGLFVIDWGYSLFTLFGSLLLILLLTLISYSGYSSCFAVIHHIVVHIVWVIIRVSLDLLLFIISLGYRGYLFIVLLKIFRSSYCSSRYWA
jgi:hypothetical protein